MQTKKSIYSVIKSEKQYNAYCKAIHELLFLKPSSKKNEDEIALLTNLIEKWQDNSWPLPPMPSIDVLKYFMEVHKMQVNDLEVLLGISHNAVLDILNERKTLTNTMIRKLSNRFYLKVEAFQQLVKSLK